MIRRRLMKMIKEMGLWVITVKIVKEVVIARDVARVRSLRMLTVSSVKEEAMIRNVAMSSWDGSIRTRRRKKTEDWLKKRKKSKRWR
jgi:hypothetical protein